MLRRARLFLLIALTAFVSARAMAGPRVVVVTSERGGVYAETLAALRSALAADGAANDIGVVEIQDLDSSALAGASVVVTIGVQAAKAIGARTIKVPVLNTLLPRDAFESQQALAPASRASAIFLDQPEQRQIALIRAALPERSTIALLTSAGSDVQAQRVVSAARALHLRVITERVASTSDIYPALERLLAEPTVLLALPDNGIFNSYTIQNVLLTTYRNRSPLIGFSPAYVRAGALLALYSTPEQMGHQAADAVRRVLAGNELPPPQGPQEFEVASNPNVARSLGLNLEPAERIAARLRQRELRP